MSPDIERVGFMETPQKVYKSLSEYKEIRKKILWSLAKGKHNKKSKGESYIFDRLKVVFSTKHKAEEIWLDYINGHIVLEAPKKKNESSASLKSRRMEYYGQLLRQVEAMTSIGVTIVYLLLNKEGKRSLEKSLARKKTNKKNKDT